MNHFGINADSCDLDTIKIQADFFGNLKLNRKKSNSTFGIILSVF